MKERVSWRRTSVIHRVFACLLFSFGLVATVPAFAEDSADPLLDAVALCLGDGISTTGALQQRLRDGGWSDAETARLPLMAEGIAIRNHVVRADAVPPTGAEMQRAISALQNWDGEGAPALESPDGLVLQVLEESVEGGRRRRCEIVGGVGSPVPNVLTFYDDLNDFLDLGTESFSAPHYRVRNESQIVVVALVQPDPIAFDMANPDRPGAAWLVLLLSNIQCEACG